MRLKMSAVYNEKAGHMEPKYQEEFTSDQGNHYYFEGGEWKVEVTIDEGKHANEVSALVKHKDVETVEEKKA